MRNEALRLLIALPFGTRQLLFCIDHKIFTQGAHDAFTAQQQRRYIGADRSFFTLPDGFAASRQPCCDGTAHAYACRARAGAHGLCVRRYSQLKIAPSMGIGFAAGTQLKDRLNKK